MRVSDTHATRPNVIVIIADDHGPWALGCAGNAEIMTPNLDRLASTGTRYTHFFCASPVCSPARASLITGRIPSHHGIHDWLRDGNGGTQPAIGYLDGITTYTDILAAHGYDCALSGKWHLGDSPTPRLGFGHWYAHQFGGGPYYGAPMIRDGVLYQEPDYLTDAITNDALQFLESRAVIPGRTNATPFYLQVGYTAPHSPWIGNHPAEIVDRYATCEFASCPQDAIHAWAGPLTTQNRGNRDALAGYFAAVTAMDVGIGRILDRLETLGLRDETLVIFTSDNGFSCGQHGFWGKGNGTFPLNMYENSVTVPTIISQPGQVASGHVDHQLRSHLDIFPTLLDYAGLPVPDRGSLPGRSFATTLSGRTGAGSDLVIVATGAHPETIHDEYGPVRMVRTDRWKYVHRYAYGPHELFDLQEDPGELVNLVADPGHATTRRELKGEIDDWFVRYADPARDGIREPVTGLGQIALAGPAGRGIDAYAAFDG